MPKCAGWPLLLLTDSDGLVHRAFVPAQLDGGDIVLWFDTGAMGSHVVHGNTGPATEPPRTVLIGGEPHALPSWRSRFQPGIAGLPMKGTLGIDTVVKHPTEMDFKGGCLTTFDDDAVPTYASAWPTVNVDMVNGMIVTDVEVDGRAQRMLFDTGVDETILVTPEAVTAKGERIVLPDVYDNPIVLIRATATMKWAGATRVSPIERTTEFHTFDMLGLGPTVRGMFGITAMGARRILFDPNRRTIAVEP